ncbi:6-phosphogluconolactonase [Bacteroidota bacterium]|nr:6-phosphogluconolactonase [Bacteroidota bacterium]
MNWNSFNDTNSLEEKLLLYIGSSLRISIKENNEALILLSGGLNSISLYKRFSEIKKIDWSKVKFGLVNERWTSDNTSISNFHNISNALGKEIVEKSSVIPLIFDNDNEQNNFSLAKSFNSPFLYEKTIVILNLGQKGQVASLFPSDEKSEKAISQISPNIFSATLSEKSISHNLKSILNTKNIILHVKGDDNKLILNKAKKQLLPVSYILNSISTQVEIYWTK